MKLLIKANIFLSLVVVLTHAKDVPFSPAWRIHNSTTAPITVNVFYKSKQPTFRSEEMPNGPVTIAPGKEEQIGLAPNTDYFFYYVPSRLEVTAGASKANWTAPKENYYKVTISSKNNALEINAKEWPVTDVIMHRSKLGKDYPDMSKHYNKNFKPRLDAYLKTH